MSFSLYIGTDIPVKNIHWDENERGFHTRSLREDEWPISLRFKKPYQKYVGSDQGDGGGFRLAGFRNGGWSEETKTGPGGHTGEVEQMNHAGLQALLEEVLSQSDEIELYVCRDGDFMRPSAMSAIIPVEAILDRKFHFHERCAYTVIGSEKDRASVRTGANVPPSS